MRSADVKPTVVTYGCYMDACIRNNDVVSAESSFSSMISEKMRPNAVIYTTLIRGLATTGQPAKAFKLFCRMREEGVEPTSAGFNSILDMIARQLSQPEVLDAVLSDVVAGAAQDHVACALLIKSSCSAGNVDNAVALFRQLRSRGMEREHAAMNALLLACARADLVPEADEVFEDMRQSGRTPNSMAAALLIKMFGRARLPAKSEEVVEALQQGF